MQLTYESNAFTATQVLREFALMGWLGLAVPTELGGQGGYPSNLRCAVSSLWESEPGTAALLCAQRLAIEALVHARNQALTQFLLPQLLSGERAAAVSQDLRGTPLQIVETERAARVSGVVSNVPHLHPDGFTLLAEATLEDGSSGWLVLRSEEDGVDVLPPNPNSKPSWARAALLGDVRCRNVFFRADEWLGSANITPHLQALRAELYAGTATHNFPLL